MTLDVELKVKKWVQYFMKIIRLLLATILFAVATGLIMKDSGMSPSFEIALLMIFLGIVVLIVHFRVNDDKRLIITDEYIEYHGSFSSYHIYYEDISDIQIEVSKYRGKDDNMTRKSITLSILPKDGDLQTISMNNFIDTEIDFNPTLSLIREKITE